MSLSDDEDNEIGMMPPPPKPAPRKINAKALAAASSGSAVSSVKIKSEKIANSASQRPVRSTRGKRQVPLPIVKMKSEKLSNAAPVEGNEDVTLESVYEDAFTDDGTSAGSSKPSEMEVC